MRRIGIVGGTFDPIHNGHLQIALSIYENCQLDEVWLLVNNYPPHKRKNSTTTNEQRLHMLHLVADKYPFIQVCDMELSRSGKSYSFDTMSELKMNHPNTLFYFAIGADNAEILHKWYKIDQLLELVTFVAIKRDGYVIKTDLPIMEVEMDYVNISSTDIRNGSDDELDQDVLSYIYKEGLYARK